jgi:hypothetical protein
MIRTVKKQSVRGRRVFVSASPDSVVLGAELLSLIVRSVSVDVEECRRRRNCSDNLIAGSAKLEIRSITR